MVVKRCIVLPKRGPCAPKSNICFTFNMKIGINMNTSCIIFIYFKICHQCFSWKHFLIIKFSHDLDEQIKNSKYLKAQSSFSRWYIFITCKCTCDIAMRIINIKSFSRKKQRMLSGRSIYFPLHICMHVFGNVSNNFKRFIYLLFPK